MNNIGEAIAAANNYQATVEAFQSFAIPHLRIYRGELRAIDIAFHFDLLIDDDMSVVAMIGHALRDSEMNVLTRIPVTHSIPDNMVSPFYRYTEGKSYSIRQGTEKL